MSDLGRVWCGASGGRYAAAWTRWLTPAVLQAAAGSCSLAIINGIWCPPQLRHHTATPPPSPLLRKLIHASEDSEDLAPLLMALEEFTGFICSPVYSWSHLERGLALTAPRTSYTKNMNSRYVYLLSDSCQVCRGTPLL